MEKLTHKDWRWIFTITYTAVIVLGSIQNQEVNPSREVTIPFVALNLVVAFLVCYLQVRIVEITWRKSTSLLRRTYDSCHRWVENSAWINRVLYGPDWRDEINSTEN